MLYCGRVDAPVGGFVVAAQVVHASDNLLAALLHISAGIGRVKLQRIGQSGGNQCRVALRELTGVFVEILVGAGLHTIDAIAHLYGVEIHLHDALFTPYFLYKESEIGLKAFPYPAVPLPQEHVLGSLLRDGASATLFAALEGDEACLQNGFLVEAVMLQEVRVLASDNRCGHVLRDKIHIHPLMLNLWVFAVDILLTVSDIHERSAIHWHPLECYYRKYRRDKEKDEDIANPYPQPVPYKLQISHNKNISTFYRLQRYLFSVTYHL